MSSSGYTPSLGGGPQPSNLITTETATLATGTTASAANPGRKSITIQNQSTNVLYVALGTTSESNGLASTTKYHFALNACVVAKDGKGGSVKVEDFTGVVSVAGTSPSYTIAEFV